jgi:hypothetical protein
MKRASRCLVPFAWLLITAAAASAQSKPQPQAKPPAQLRGFGVVLLEGSQQASGSNDLPPAASAAIADIKDFLPFKSYRLLDSSWTLGSNAVQEYTSRLQGTGQQYQVRIGSKVDAASSSVDVKFTLQDAATARSPLPPLISEQAAALNDATGKSLVQEQAYTASLEAQLAALQRKADTPPQEVAALRARLEESRDRAGKIRAQSLANERLGHFVFTAPREALIDTSFTMRLGETVVVGTSRVGGDKALIVLLTAAPASAKP